jgi:hypothetical protein
MIRRSQLTPRDGESSQLIEYMRADHIDQLPAELDEKSRCSLICIAI